MAISSTWRRVLALFGASVFLATCQTTGLNPTGLLEGEVKCQEGPRRTLDCRGAIQQYARDIRADVTAAQHVTVGIGLLSNKLIEADAITSDLVQHYYQTCTLYNACLISPEQYVAKTERLQEIQLSVRRALAAAGVGAQQNIQINPTPGGVIPGPVPPGGGPPGGPVPGGPVFVPPGAGRAPGGSPVGASSDPAQQRPAPTAAGAQPPDTVDAVLNILREGSRLLARPAPTAGATAAASAPPVTPVTGGSPAPVARSPVPSGSAPSVAPSAGTPAGTPQDLESSLRGLLATLKEGIVRREPGLATARAAVGNFTEEGSAWSGPLGALLQEQVALLVQSGVAFAPASGSLARGISVTQVAGVVNPNDPQALPALLGGDLAITGTYRVQDQRVSLRLSAVDGKGGDLGQAAGSISARAIPGEWAASAANTAVTDRLLSALGQLGPRSQGTARVEVTTNRPGAGASFRVGEEIRYFVNTSMTGYLYLFHVDADGAILRIFPNRYQQNARIRAGEVLDVPGREASFKFEAAPPFGLETTFAIVTAMPLDDRDFESAAGGFARPKQAVPEIVASRGVRVVPVPSGGSAPASAAAPASGSPTGQAAEARPVWNHVTVLVRP